MIADPTQDRKPVRYLNISMKLTLDEIRQLSPVVLKKDHFWYLDQDHQPSCPVTILGSVLCHRVLERATQHVWKWDGAGARRWVDMGKIEREPVHELAAKSLAELLAGFTE